MKILIKPNVPIEDYKKNKEIDGFILPLEGYAVDYEKYFTLKDVEVVKENTTFEVFVVINRMFFNKDIEILKELLLELEKLKVTGIFFYDLAVLELSKTMNLKTPLVWNNTHMVTNYEVCNYYQKKGIKYAVLSNEITFKEAIEIYKNTNIILMFPLLLYPTVANSYRHLVTNYDKINHHFNDKYLEIEEQVTKEKYFAFENPFGTTFKYGKVLNNIPVYTKLKELNFPYVILQEDFIEHEKFIKILSTINKKDSIQEIEKLVGKNTGFLEKETIYKVKKNG